MDKAEVYRGWRNAGFLSEEAEELTYGKEGVEVNSEAVYNSAPGRAARAGRQQWIKGLLAQGWTKEEIEREARAYYTRDTSRSPWDFIRLEYKPREKKDYQEAARRRAEAQVKTLYRR